jgi:hypothetical protein
MHGEPRRSAGLSAENTKGQVSAAFLIQAALRVDLTLAHLARCAAAILCRAETDIVRFFGFSVMPFAFAQRAL